MKPIDQMNLAEAITALRDVDVITRGYHCNFDAIEELTNRIDTLLFEQAQRHDAWVDALENKINSLEAERRWIPVSERMPTEEDANHEGNVLGLSNEGDVWVPHITSVQAGYGYKAWQRITPPEATP
jgi:hypothetical protein